MSSACSRVVPMPVIRDSNTPWYLIASAASMPIMSWAVVQKPLPSPVSMS